MSAQVTHPNNATKEEKSDCVPHHQAEDTMADASSPPEDGPKGQAAPVHSTSAFKPDPFW